MSAALQARDLTVHLGGRQVIEGLNLQIAAGRWTCIVGPNGAGKSTVLRALAGLLAHRGQVLWQGVELSEISPRERARRLSWLGQNEPVAEELRVHDLVMLGRLPHQGWLAGPGVQDQDAVEEALRAVQAWDWRDLRVDQLSGGEQQRVLLARALAVKAPLLLMDEPLSHLDPPHQADWLAKVQEIKSQGVTVISVMHEINLALQADEMLIMRGGRLMHQGSCLDARTHRAIEAVFDHRLALHALEGRWVALPASSRGD